MTMKCQCCSHKNAKSINKAIVSGQTLSKIAKEYRVSYNSIYYHSQNHLSVALLKSHKTREFMHSNDLMAEIKSLYERSLIILNKAENSNKLATAVGAIAQVRGNLEFVVKLMISCQEQMLNEKRREENLNRRQNLEYDLNGIAVIVKTLMEAGALRCPRCDRRLENNDSFQFEHASEEKPRMIRTSKPPDNPPGPINDEDQEESQGQIEVWEGGKLIGHEKVEGFAQALGLPIDFVCIERRWLDTLGTNRFAQPLLVLDRHFVMPWE